MAQRTSTTVEIHGKETVSKASKNASASLNRLEGQTKSFSQNSQKNLGQLVSKFGLYAAAVGGAVIAVKRLVDAYATQEAAERKLSQAIENNPMLDSGSARRIQAFASELQQVSVIGDEVSLSMATMLATTGRTEDQIRDILTVAADLSAAMDMDMRTAVVNLNKTFGGTVGELGEVIPELKNLSKEQLEAGEAVGFLSQQVEGQAEALRNTTQGAMQAFSNSWGDLKENLGGAAATIFNPLVKGLSTLVEGFNDAVAAIRDFNEARREAEEVEAGTASEDTLRRVLNRQLGDAREDQADLQRRIDQYSEDIAKSLVGVIEQDTAEFDAALAEALEREVGPLQQRLDAAQRLENQIARQLAELSAGTSAGGGGGEGGERPLSEIDRKAIAIQAQLRETFSIIEEKMKIPATELDEAEAKRDAVVGALNELFELGAQVEWASIQNVLDTYSEYLQEEEKAITRAAGDPSRSGLSLTSGQGGQSYGTTGSGGLYTPTPGAGDQLLGAMGGFGGVMSSASSAVEGFGGELMGLVGEMGPLGFAVATVNQLLEGFMQIMGPIYSDLLEPLGNMLGELGAQIGNLLLPLVNQMAPALQLTTNILGTVLAPILEALAPVLEFLGNLWGTLVIPQLKVFASAIEIVVSLMTWFRDRIKWVGDNFGVLIRNLIERAATFGHNLLEILKTPKRAIEVLVSWLEALGKNIGEVIDYVTSLGTDPIKKHSGDSFGSISPNMRDPKLASYIDFDSDALTGLPDRLKEIWDMEGGNFVPGEYASDSGGVHGGNTTVQRAPDNYITINQYGPLDPVSSGEAVVDALSAYFGAGGTIPFLEAT